MTDDQAREFWQHHIDKVAKTRVQTPDQLTVRREKLAAAICSYLQSLSNKTNAPARRQRKRSVSSNVVRTRGMLINTWRCTEAWVKTWDNFLTQYGKAPSKHELTKYLGFQLEITTASSGRKKGHVVKQAKAA